MREKLRKLTRQLAVHFTVNNAVLGLAVLIAGSWMWNTIDAIQRNFVLQQRVDAATQEVAVHELENKTLQLQKNYYLTPEYLELSARERLGKVAAGEKVLILPANTVKPVVEAPPEASEVPITERSNYAQWMYFLFGKKG